MGLGEVYFEEKKVKSTIVSYKRHPTKVGREKHVKNEGRKPKKCGLWEKQFVYIKINTN